MENQLIETWHIHNRINLYLLDNIETESLGGKLGGKGRTIGEQFEHIHNVRLMWLDSAAPDLRVDLVKFEKNQSSGAADLRHALEKSGEAIAALLQVGLTSGKIKGFKPHPTAFLGYLISHESYHRGEIGLILSHIGHPLDRKVAYGIWEWGTR